MTTLNSHLKLAMLNRKKTKSALQKGFTLIELLITVVILGFFHPVLYQDFGTKTADIAAANAQGKHS